MSYTGDATGEYITLGDHTIPTATGSLVHWFFPTWGSLTDGVDHAWISHRKTNASPINLFILQKFTDNNLYCGWYTADVEHRVITAASGSGLNLGAWNSIVLTWDDTANQSALYINGTQAGSTTSTLVTHDTGASPESPSRLLNQSVTDATSATGALAHVAYFDTVLLAGEIAAFNSGYSPLLFSRHVPVFYFPLVRDLIEVRQGISVTNTNCTVGSEPRLYRRTSKRKFLNAPSAAAAPKLWFNRPVITWAG
jgi:Concanavalin A-like lectin/glucanases superfamily